jgi:hypothetical protein
MLTILLALIEAKYKYGYQLLFFAAIILDIIAALITGEILSQLIEAWKE